MKSEIGTGDVVVGVLAAIGVIVLIVLFVHVVRTVFMNKEGE